MTMAAVLPLTPARRVILAAGLPVVLALIAFASYGWVQRAVSYLASETQVGYSVGFSVPAAGGRARVTTGDASLSVRAGASRQIEVRGHLSSSFARPRFSYRSTAAGLALDPSCRVPSGTCSLSFGITVPAGLPVSVSDSFGGLNARGLRGTVATVGQQRGPDRVPAGREHPPGQLFGTISASGLSGRIQLDNNSGDIRASG